MTALVAWMREWDFWGWVAAFIVVGWLLEKVEDIVRAARKP